MKKEIHLILFRNQNGTSLIQVLIATAIVGILSLGIASTMSLLQKERKAGQESISKNELYINAVKTLTSNASCFSAVQEGAARSFNSRNPNATIGIRRIPTVAGGTDYLAERGQPFSPSSPWMTVLEINLTDFRSTGVANYFKGNFVISLNPDNMVRTLAPIKVPVIVQTDPVSPPNAKRIVACGVEDSIEIGQHCGVFTQGSDFNGMIPCKGLNPRIQCPPNFQQFGGDYQSPGNRWFVTCIKVR